MKLRWVWRSEAAPEYGPHVERQVRVLQVGELERLVFDPVTAQHTKEVWDWRDVPTEMTP